MSKNVRHYLDGTLRLYQRSHRSWVIEVDALGYKPKQYYKLSQPALVTVWRKLTEDAHILASLTDLNGMKFKPNIRGNLAHANYLPLSKSLN